MSKNFDNKVNYAGTVCTLVHVYDESVMPYWQNPAQARIDAEKKAGRVACCIHKGKEHGLYVSMEG